MTVVVKLKKAWKIWPIGHVIPEMAEGTASDLVRRGIGEEVKAMRSPVNRMMQAMNRNQAKPTMKLR
jgi:hypothetical protein